jgi:hypothetical protein
MSYELAYSHLDRCQQTTSEGRVDYGSLVQASAQLVGTLEADQTQMEMAGGRRTSLRVTIQKQTLAADKVLQPAKDRKRRCR